jgi:flagellar FliJ protein
VSYKFRLQRVLDWRLQLEEEQNRRLGHAYRETAEAKGELDRLKTYLDKLQAEYSSCQSEQVDVSGALLAADFLDSLSSRLTEQRSLVEQCETRLAEQMRLAEKAQQERKAMDSLREKDFIRYRREAEALEQRLTDEAARYAYLAGIQRSEVREQK